MSDHGYQESDESLSPDEPGPPGVLAVTDRPLTIEVREIESDLPEGLISAGTFLDDRLVARTALPVGAIEHFQRHGFFDQPRQLVLAAREGDPGLRCDLFAIVPIAFMDLEEDGEAVGEDGAEPWLAAADSQGYERALQTDPNQADSDAESMQFAVLLGEIVRFDRDRKHPESLALEAVDILAKVVQGKVIPVVDKVLEDLLRPGNQSPEP